MKLAAAAPSSEGRRSRRGRGGLCRSFPHPSVTFRPLVLPVRNADDLLVATGVYMRDAEEAPPSDSSLILHPS
jgi:hypothetical protein